MKDNKQFEEYYYYNSLGAVHLNKIMLLFPIVYLSLVSQQCLGKWK